MSTGRSEVKLTEVVAGVPKNFPPEYAIDPKNNKPIGFAIDVMDELARKAGLKVRYEVFDDWSALHRAIRDGLVDIVPNEGITEERRDFLDFTSPVETFTIDIFVRSPGTDISGIDDLKGRKVAVIAENKGLFLMQNFGKADLVIASDIEKAFLSLLSGSVDALMCPAPPLLRIARQGKLADRIKKVGPPLLEIKRAVGVKKGEPLLYSRLDREIKMFVVSADYKRIYAKWYGSVEPYWNIRRVLIAAGLLIAFSLGLLASWHYHSLRRLNRQLKESLDKLKKQDEALEKSYQDVHMSEQKLKALLNLGNDAIMIVDPSGHILEVNDVTCSRLGYGREELLQMTPRDFDTPEYGKRVQERLAEICAKGSSIFETAWKTKDGRTIPTEISARAIEYEGQPAVLSFARDITERIKSEEALRVREQQLRESQRVAQVGSWDWDSISDTIMWSDEYYRIYGLDPKKPTPNYAEHLNAYMPESAALLDSAVKRAMETGEGYELDLELASPTETNRWICARGEVKRDTGGRIVGLRGTAQNITQRRQAEDDLWSSKEFIKNILETVDEGFIVIDPGYRIISANKAYLEMVGISEAEAIGECCYKLSHRLCRPCCEVGEDCAVSRTLMTGDPQTAVHTHTGRDGQPVFVSIKSYALRDGTGKIIGAIEVIDNITERRKLEDQLRHAQKMEAIGTLAGGVAHDFNNILSVIMGYGEMVKERLQDDSVAKEQINEVLSAAERAASLTKRLLAFSRKQPVDIRPVDIITVLSGMVKMISRIIGEDIVLTIDFAEQPMIVKADAAQIEQVIMNLVSNARDAMSKGGRLTIGTEVREIDDSYIAAHGYGAPGRYVLISVTDTGIGIDAETQKKIFEPYFTTKGLGRGTGLGLAIAYGIIKQHNGYINVYSEQGKGTTFRILLPISEEESAGQSAAPVEPAKGGTETILVAEDEPSLRKLMKLVLESRGYSVITSENGEDVIAKYRENRDTVQLVIFDMIMPKKSGKEAYHEIREISPDLKALFVSGYTMDISTRKDLLGEDVEVINKPVSPNDLIRKVREVLDR